MIALRRRTGDRLAFFIAMSVVVPLKRKVDLSCHRIAAAADKNEVERASEHLGARVPLAWTTAHSTRETVGGIAVTVPQAPAATTVTRKGGDARFRPGRLRRAANCAAR